VAALAGCTAGIGATAARTWGDPHATSLGGKLGERAYFWGDSAPMIGLEEAVITRTENTACCEQWRISALGGYASLPLPYQSRFGYEFDGAVGGARIPVAGGHSPALTFGAQAALPIRLSPSAMPWGADDLLGRALQVVPDVTFSGLAPTDKAPVRFDLAVGLSLRLQVYSGALP
jgi:hypothetical protein